MAEVQLNPRIHSILDETAPHDFFLSVGVIEDELSPFEDLDEIGFLDELEEGEIL